MYVRVPALGHHFHKIHKFPPKILGEVKKSIKKKKNTYFQASESLSKDPTDQKTLSKTLGWFLWSYPPRWFHPLWKVDTQVTRSIVYEMFHHKILVRWSGRKRARDSSRENAWIFPRLASNWPRPYFSPLFIPCSSPPLAPRRQPSIPPLRDFYDSARGKIAFFQPLSLRARLPGEVSSTQFIPQILRVTFFQWNWKGVRKVDEIFHWPTKHRRTQGSFYSLPTDTDGNF